jgi:beta-N-acetylhexosaminidase
MPRRRVAAVPLVAAAVLAIVGCGGMVAAASSRSAARSTQPSISKAVGQLIIATYNGTTPPASILSAVRAGQIGAIILMGDNTGDSVAVTRRATDALQRAARSGHNPGLLIMTDQEGGEVKRLPNGAPAYAAAQMSNPQRASYQGYQTGELLKRAGVNVDLAPVADVSVIDGFMTQEQRTFGNSAGVVARAACAFADGLKRAGVAYTLKHFPGLGDAKRSTDNVAVDVTQSAAGIHADDAAYRSCDHGPLALAMISSASYKHLTGNLPAVLAPVIYRTVLPDDGVSALSISDSFESGAIAHWSHPARRALAAGLDMVMYPGEEGAALSAYPSLVTDVKNGSLSHARVTAAAERVLALKRALGLG